MPRTHEIGGPGRGCCIREPTGSVTRCAIKGPSGHLWLYHVQRVLLMTKVRAGGVATVVIVIASIGTIVALGSCASTPASPPPSAPPSTSSPECTGRDSEAVLRAFFHDLSNNRDVRELLSAYIAPPEDFVRWWDPTTADGE